MMADTKQMSTSMMSPVENQEGKLIRYRYNLWRKNQEKMTFLRKS